MTVTATTTRTSFSGNSNQGPHTISFIILDATHIEVYWEKGSSSFGTPITSGSDFTAGTSGYLVKDVHYTVQNAGTSSNATITYIASGFTVDSTVTYPTSSDTIVVTRNVPLTQTSDYTNNSTIDAETIENNFDKLTQISQQLDDNAGHSLKLSSALEGSTGFDTTPSKASTISLNKADRSNNLISFDSNGDIIATQELGSWRGNWVTGTAYVERDLVKDAEAGAVYLCLVGHDSGTFATDLSASKWESIIDAGGFNVKLTGDVTVDEGETLVTPYKIDLNGNRLTNNGTIYCAEILTGTGTFTGGESSSTIQSGPINLTDAGVALTSNAVTVAGVQTLTNKTLTSPKINEDVVMSATATELNVMDGSATTQATVTLVGTDGVVISDADVMKQALVSDFDTYVSGTTKTLTNKTLTAPKIADAGFIADANGAEQLVFQTTGSAENHFEMTNAADSNAPQLASVGDDTDVGMTLNTKGTGSYVLKVGNTTALTIALSGGNTTITGP